MEREREYEGRLTAFYRTLEEAIGRLPAEVRASLYRLCCGVRAGDVLQEMRRQFEECGCDLDRQYARYGRTPYFFADVIEPGRVYEIGYPRCLCPQVAAGFTDAPTHCECSRESILFVLQDLLPGRDICVECLGPSCRAARSAVSGSRSGRMTGAASSAAVFFRRLGRRPRV